MTDDMTWADKAVCPDCRCVVQHTGRVGTVWCPHCRITMPQYIARNAFRDGGGT